MRNGARAAQIQSLSQIHVGKNVDLHRTRRRAAGLEWDRQRKTSDPSCRTEHMATPHLLVRQVPSCIRHQRRRKEAVEGADYSTSATRGRGNPVDAAPSVELRYGRGPSCRTDRQRQGRGRKAIISGIMVAGGVPFLLLWGHRV